MKLLRYGEPGHEKPGCLDADANIRDLSHIINDIAGNDLEAETLNHLRSLKLETLPLVASPQRIGACVNQVGKFICIGLNYADHAQETGAEIPSEPVVFLKATSAISGPNDPIVIPHGSTKTDWEVELGIVIGKKGKHIKEENANAHIAGYCVINDVSERHFQKYNTSQWAKGKSCDTFGPLGPWLVTADEIPQPQRLSLWLEVDGKRQQDGSSSDMIFKVPYLISYLSRFFTLYPGDIISTGTPAGVGAAHKPEAIFLKEGQTVKLGITGLGEQNHLVITEKML